MLRLVFISLILTLFNLSAKAAKIQYSPAAEKLIVSQVALGEKVVIKESQLAELIQDIESDPYNIDGTIFIRIFLTNTDRAKIEKIIKTAKPEALDFSEPLIRIETTPDPTARKTKVKYAQVPKNTPVLSSLYYHHPDSIQCLDDFNRFIFSVKNFDAIERKSIVVFQIDIDNVYNFIGDFEFTINLDNNPDSDSGSGGSGDGGSGDSGSGSDGSGGGGTTAGGDTTGGGSADASISAGIEAFSIRVTDTQELINKNYICNPINTSNLIENICDQIDLQTLSTNLSIRIAQMKTNKNFLESLSLSLKQKRKNKEISKLDNRSLQNQILKALKVNTDAVKRLKVFKTKIDKVRSKSNTFEPSKKQNILQQLRALAQTKVNRVDSLVNTQIASDLLRLGLIDQTTYSSL